MLKLFQAQRNLGGLDVKAVPIRVVFPLKFGSMQLSAAFNQEKDVFRIGKSQFL
jgi:hypothetical protein